MFAVLQRVCCITACFQYRGMFVVLWRVCSITACLRCYSMLVVLQRVCSIAVCLQYRIGSVFVFGCLSSSVGLEVSLQQDNSALIKFF